MDGRGGRIVVGQEGRRTGQRRNVFKITIEEEVLTCRLMEKKCITSEGREVDASNSTCQSTSCVIFNFYICRLEE